MNGKEARLYAGFVSLERGVDGGRPSVALRADQASWAVNTTFRGGFATCRPGYRKLPLLFGEEGSPGLFERLTAFQGGRWQGAGAYQYDTGNTVLVCAMGGRVFQIRLNPPHLVSEIPVPEESNVPLANKVWLTQAEQWLVLQDGQGRPLFFDGESLRLSNAHIRGSEQNEVLIGTRMSYFMGRLWVANGRDYTAGDLVWGVGPDGYPTRATVLQMTECTFLDAGGFFTVPVASGEITGLAYSVNLDTALGQGDLLVFTRQGVFATNVPVDRTAWAAASQPLQRVVLPSYGAVSQESIVTANSDTFFRSGDGIRSLIMAQRAFGTWGNTPISREVARAMEQDDPALLDWCSAVVFDNRLLCTVAPQRHARGVIWKGMVALNFDTVSRMGTATAPAWEGVWTGLNLLQVVKAWVLGVERCFAFAVNGAGQIELWELSRNDPYDHEAEPILWSVETRGFDFESGRLKRLLTGALWVGEVQGRVSFQVQFRADEYPCWVPWHAWEECATDREESADPGCKPLPNYRPQYRPRMALPQPTDDCDASTGRPHRQGYEFQVRLQIQGKARVKKLRLAAWPESEPDFGEPPQGRCP